MLDSRTAYTRWYEYNKSVDEWEAVEKVGDEKREPEYADKMAYAGSKATLLSSLQTANTRLCGSAIHHCYVLVTSCSSQLK